MGQNVGSVSWGDHLLFGTNDGRLNTPHLFERRLNQWKKKLGINTILWREKKTGLSFYFSVGKGYKGPTFREKVLWDDFEVIPRICHDQGA
jgi:hypothetical protein